MENNERTPLLSKETDKEKSDEATKHENTGGTDSTNLSSKKRPRTASLSHQKVTFNPKRRQRSRTDNRDNDEEVDDPYRDSSSMRSSDYDEPSDEEDEMENRTFFTPQNCSLRQIAILVVLLVATLTSSLAVCLFPPFFPKIAEEKGCSATVYGLIIGTNCLTSFIVTPYIGKHLPRIGVRFALIIGMFVGGVCCALSGLLEFISPGWEFVAVSVFLRIVHATGNAMVITATFTYSATEFASNVGKVFSLTRTAMNLAQLFGPTVGGAIYGAGSFYLPFVVMGITQVCMSLISIPFLPSCKLNNKPSHHRRGKDVSVWNVVFTPTIWISFLTFIVATACNGFLSIHLEPKVLRRFDMRPVFVGLIFGLKDGANSIASPIWGYFCDRNRKSSVKPYIIMSAFLVAGSFFLLGANKLLGWGILDLDEDSDQAKKKALAIVILALILNGIGIGGEQVSGLIDALHEAVHAGYPDNASMHGLIAGLWSSLSGLGRFVSRGGSGALVDYFGFNVTASIAMSLQLGVAAITFIYMLLFEILIRRARPVRWENVTVVEEGSNDEVFFTETNSPSESVMGRSVHIEVPSGRRYGRRHSRSGLPNFPARTTLSRSAPHHRRSHHHRDHSRERRMDEHHSASSRLAHSFIGSESFY